MADITESSVWEDSIYELSTTDPVKGGTPVIGVDGSVVSGHANVQAQLLANRTKYLKQRVDAWPETVDAAGTANGLVVAHNSNPNAHPELIIAAAAEADRASSEADRAETAADAAMATGKVYVDTAAGIAATTNGQYFSVPSAESTEYLILYKNNAGVALEVKRYPSTSAINTIQDAARTAVTQCNLFSRSQLLAQVMPDSVVSGDVSASTVSDLPTIKLVAQPSTQARVLWRFSRSLISGNSVSLSVVVASSNAGASGNFVRVGFRDAVNASLGTVAAAGVTSLAITQPVTYKVDAAAIPANTAFIEFDCAFTADASTTRETHLRGMYIGSGSSSYFRSPDEVGSLLGRVSTLERKLLPRYVGNLAILPPVVGNKLKPLGVILEQDFSSNNVRFSYHERNEAKLSTNKTTYYFSPTGNNANSGLTRALPKRSVGTFVNSLTPTTDIEIILLGGPSIFYRNDSLSSATWNHPYHLSIVSETEALLTSAENPGSLVWSANGAAWQTTRSAVGNVFDAAIRDYRGVPVQMVNKASVAEVQATAGSWYTDGVTLYVRMFDGRTPDANLLALLSTGSFTATISSGKTLYMENIKLGLHLTGGHGTRVTTPDGGTGYLTSINCAFFGASRNGFESIGVTLAYSRNCTAAHNSYDGFNHHDTLAAPQSVAVESGCHAYNNGNFGGSGTNNGSTAHDGMTMVRCDGLYYDCYGPVVADVNGCKSFNINSFSAKSTLPLNSPTGCSWYFDNVSAVSAGETWLVGCGSSDSQYDVNADTTSTIVNARGWQGGSPILGPSISTTRY